MIDEAVLRLFPHETWTRIATRVWLAGTRAAQGVKSNSERQKLQREIAQASLLAKYGHYVYLVPETGSGKHYDAIVDGVPTEFKEVTGGIGAVSKRFSAAMKQGHDAFLKIDSPLQMRTVYQKIKGEVLFNGYTEGTVYIYLCGRLYRWRISNIRQDTK